MFYYVGGLVIGTILIISSIYLLIKNKSNIISNIIYLICGIGYIVSGILGFIIDEKYEFVIILLLILFSFLSILTYYIFNKKSNPNKKNINLTKKNL